MSYLDNYKRRLQAQAGRKNSDIDLDNPVTLRESINNRSRQSQERSFFESPTLTNVEYNNIPDTPVIQSDRYKDIDLQTFLFQPEYPVKLGTIIKSKGLNYLAVSRSNSEMYPVLICRLCNDFFDVPVETERRAVNDRFGNVRYVEESKLEQVPAVISDKDYSVSGNFIMPLPAGRINIEMPYKKEYLDYFTVNYEFTHNTGTYQVTDAKEYRITPDEVYIQVSATAIQSEGAVRHDE